MDNIIPIRLNTPESFKTLASKSTHNFRFPFIFDGTETEGATVDWTVKNLLIGGGVSAVYGAPKSGKSFFAQDLAERVSRGMSFFGRRTKPGLVIYMCGEGIAGFKRRMTAWREVNDQDPSRNFIMMPATFNLVSDTDAIDAVIADIKAICVHMNQPVAMIVVDTLNRYFGGNDENSASDMSCFVSSIGRMQEALDQAFNMRPHVMIVHHTGKNASDGMRGSNALRGALDCSIEVMANEDGIRQARVVDMKDGGNIDPMYYRLRSIKLGDDEDGEAIYSCAVERTSIEGPFETEKPKGRGPAKKAAA
jgi:hypothetical protein